MEQKSCGRLDGNEKKIMVETDMIGEIMLGIKMIIEMKLRLELKKMLEMNVLVKIKMIQAMEMI